MHSREYTSTDVTDCLDNICPKISVMVRGGDVTDSDCTSRAYPKYQQDADDVTLVRVVNRLHPNIEFYTYIAYMY